MEFDSRFQNWVRWCKARGVHQARVGSAEGEYRSSQIWEQVEPKGEGVDSVDAQFLNRAYSQIDKKSRRVIKVIYFREYWKAKWQAQKLGINEGELERAALGARFVFKGRVAFLESRTDNAPTVDPVFAPWGAAFS